MYKACLKCRQQFWVSDEEGWKKTCLTCWKKSKGLQDGAQDKNYQRIVELESLNRVLYSRIAALERLSTSSIDSEMLRRLIMLTHPDKHNNSQASIKATQFLLDMKKS
jgi:PHP family Zn ribbon phosphoesterase